MNDFRYALRTLRRSPGVAAAAIASLALGIGANTAIFSVTNAVILRSMPVEKPEELVLARYASKKGNIFDSFGHGEYLALRDSKSLSGLAALASASMNVASQDSTERVPGLVVSGNFFDVLKARARLGTLISPADDSAAPGDPVCVISYSLWQKRFGSASGIVGQRLEINGKQYRILGVTAEGFNGIDQGDATQIYVPLSLSPEIFSNKTKPGVQPPFRDWQSWLKFVGRLSPGVTASRAQAELDARFATLPLANQDFTFESSNRHTSPGTRGRLFLDEGRQGFDYVRFTYSRPLTFLLFLVGLLLLIACANVAGLLVARTAGQRRQIAIRLALGAGRWALIRQQLAESALLAVGGTAAGLLLSVWTTDLLTGLVPDTRIDAHIDFAVLGFVIGVACLTVVLFGVAPALESGKTGVGVALKSESTGGGRKRGALAPALVILQVAISVTLLAGAGLLVRSLHNLHSVALGFQPENVLVASISNSGNKYPVARMHSLTEDLIHRAETIPGVKMASASLVSPLSGSLWLYSVDVPGYPKQPKEIPMAYVNAIGPNYFATIGSSLIRGREFTSRDREGSPAVAIINEQMAHKYWPGRDPIGQRFKASVLNNAEIEVVGLTRDSVYRDLREAKQDILYVPIFQANFGSATLHLRFQGDAARVMNELRTQAQAADRSVPLYGMKTLETQIDNTLTAERLLALVSTVLGGLAILLASIGLYSVLANTVAQRAREIGIRMALGAARKQVIGLVLRDTLWMVALGVAVGIPVALGASRWISSYLFDIKPHDPSTYIAIAIMIFAAGIAAALVPSQRASRVDPMVVLRCD
jgi:predicted permease